MFEFSVLSLLSSRRSRSELLLFGFFSRLYTLSKEGTTVGDTGWSLTIRNYYQAYQFLPDASLDFFTHSSSFPRILRGGIRTFTLSRDCLGSVIPRRVPVRVAMLPFGALRERSVHHKKVLEVGRSRIIPVCYNVRNAFARRPKTVRMCL